MPNNATDKTDKKTVQADAPPARLSFTDEEVTYLLESPITVGNGSHVIERLTLRKPRAGELRGLSLADVMRLEMDALATLLPRITTPTLHKPMIDEMEPVDLNILGRCIMGFFSTKKQRASSIGETEALLKL